MQRLRIFTTKNTKRAKDDNSLQSNPVVAVVPKKPSFVSFVPFVVKSVSVRRLFTEKGAQVLLTKNTKLTKNDKSLQNNSVVAPKRPSFPSFVSFVVKPAAVVSKRPSFVVNSVSVRRRAMTLIELLAVMAIMVILIGAVVVAVLSASRQGPRKGTTGLLLQLAQGLEQYKATYGMYVPVDNIANTSPPLPYLPYPVLDVNPPATLQLQASTFALWQALEYDGQYVSVAGAWKAPGGMFTDPKTGAWPTTWYYYKDYWGTPIGYVCPPPYNQYTLTSAGEDRIFGTPDDIVQP